MTSAAILTGDLIGSTRAGAKAVDRAMTALLSAAKALKPVDGGREPRFTRFRGDGWQIYVHDPGAALLAMLVLTARLRAADCGLGTRIACGIGATGPLDSDLSTASGPAFEASGRLLDSLPRGKRLAIAGDGVGTWQTAVVDLADLLSSRWSAPQAEAMAIALLTGRPQVEIAIGLGITRQAVQARLSGAGHASFDTALKAFRHHDWTAP